MVIATSTGHQSAASPEASTTPQLPAPGMPTLTAGNAQVEASWTAVPNATGYTVYYSTTSLASADLTTISTKVDVTGASATVSELTNGTQYYFVVIATSTGHQSTASTEETATPQLPAPSSLRLAKGNAELAAVWAAVPNATGYTLYYSTSPLASTTDLSGAIQVDISGGSMITTLVTGLTNGSTYYFRVIATSADHQSAASDQADATPQLPAPVGLTVTPGNAQVATSWLPVPNATGYTLYYSISSPTETTDCRVSSVTATGTSATVTGLTNGTTYCFVVVATSTGGESAASTEARAAPRIPAVGAVFRDTLSGGGQGPQMVVLPTGSFSRGSPSTEEGRFTDEQPVVTVTISKRIAMGRYEVTFDDYKRFTDDSATTRTLPADQGWGRGTRPVINVSRDDAKAYAAWLSTQTGRTYRLPSEAEWEYAARAGTTMAYSFGASINCSQANYARRPGDPCNSGSNASLARTVGVGSFSANDFGLYDMHGNVWEWVEDCYNVGTGYTGAPTDGSARTSCNAVRFVLRGGSWSSSRFSARSAERLRVTSSSRRSNNLGFRLVQDLSP